MVFLIIHEVGEREYTWEECSILYVFGYVYAHAIMWDYTAYGATWLMTESVGVFAAPII